MIRRTKRLEEFEFEEENDNKGQLAIIIVISGWMDNPGDYRRNFGLVPKHDDMELLEKLERFYFIYCPEVRLIGSNICYILNPLLIMVTYY